MNAVGHPLTHVDTPCLWVDLDILERNISYLAARLTEAGVNWRPHIKGIKVPAIAYKALRAGALGVTCAKVSEAEVMVYAGVTGILIANQIVGPIKTARLAALGRTANVMVAVDDAANVAELSRAASAAASEIGVLVEVNVGMDRAGVLPGEPALALSRLVHQSPGLRYRGLMGWEGHATAITDWAERRAVIERELRKLVATAQLCREAGLPVEVVSGAGSMTYPAAISVPGLTEVQAGGAIFSDVNYRDGGSGTTPALFVQTMVTSRPTPERIICDAGFKSLPTWAETPEPLGLANVAGVSASAEHLTITLSAPDNSVKPGDRIDFIVGYGDSTVFLHDHLYGVRAGCVEAVWPIAGRGKLQ